jgi:hypothetical protein
MKKGKHDMTAKNDITPKQLAFAVFCIENIGEYLSLHGGEIYVLLTEKSDILDNYIIPFYDALHTQGSEYIVREIVEMMKARGII